MIVINFHQRIYTKHLGFKFFKYSQNSEIFVITYLHSFTNFKSITLIKIK